MQNGGDGWFLYLQRIVLAQQPRAVPWQERSQSAVSLLEHFVQIAWSRTKNKAKRVGQSCYSRVASAHKQRCRDSTVFVTLSEADHWEGTVWLSEALFCVSCVEIDFYSLSNCWRMEMASPIVRYYLPRVTSDAQYHRLLLLIRFNRDQKVLSVWNRHLLLQQLLVSVDAEIKHISPIQVRFFLGPIPVSGTRDGLQQYIFWYHGFRLYQSYSLFSLFAAIPVLQLRTTFTWIRVRIDGGICVGINCWSFRQSL